MLSFLLAVTINSFLFMGFLGISMAHANGDDTTVESKVDTPTCQHTMVIDLPMPKEPMAVILSSYKPAPDQENTGATQTSALRRRPCGDRGFDVIIIEHSRLRDGPIQMTKFADDDCLQINYPRKKNAFGEIRVPLLRVENFADDTGAYVKLDGVTIAEVQDGQFMSPDNINLVAV